MDGADIVHGGGHEGRGPAHGLPVGNLGAKHIFLYIPCEEKQRRQQAQQHQAEAKVFPAQHDKNADDLAQVGKHADDTGAEQVFHRVHVAYKPGDQLSGLPGGQRAGGQAGELCHHTAAQAVGDFLAEDGEQALPGGFQQPRQGQQAEIQQHLSKGRGGSGGERIHDFCQHQRRQQGGNHGPHHRQHNAEAEPYIFLHRLKEHGADIFLVMHGSGLLPGLPPGHGRRGPFAAVPRGYRR